MPTSFRKLVGPASGLVLILAAGVASAYVLPTYSILRRMVEKRDDLRLGQLTATGTLHLLPPFSTEAGEALNVPGERQISANGTLQLKLPGRCRLQLETPEGGLAVAVSAHGKRRTEGAQLAPMNQAVTQLCALLALRSSEEGESRAAVERHLRALGVDTRVTGLGRFDGKITYVIGARGEGAPQFWVYKDSFLPARIRYTEGGTNWDVRFRNFGSPVAGDWIPRIVEVARGENTVLRFTALTADARAPLADNLF